MSNAKRKIEGTATEIGGKLEKAAGQMIGDERLEAEGRARELRGKGRKEAAKAGERVEGKTQELGGKLERIVGNAIGSEEMLARGRAKELRGEAKQRANKRS